MQKQKPATASIRITLTTTGSCPIQREVRQWDPLSLILFIIALNPPTVKIRTNKRILPSPNPIKDPPKRVAYEDHITLTINYNQTFPKWVKFKTRPKKTRTSTNKKLNLSKIYQSQCNTASIAPLNVPIGLPTTITAAWNKQIKLFEKKKTETLNQYFAACNLKTIITKPILTPHSKLRQYVSLPKQKQETINIIISIRLYIYIYIAGPTDPALPSTACRIPEKMEAIM